MVKVLKMIIFCTLGSVLATSCLKDSGSRIYAELHSVIKSNMGVMYFSSDDGIDLYLENGLFNPEWGNEGDRILVGFYYNPATITENTTKMNITVETLIPIQTERSALPSTVDTVGTGVFLHENSNSNGIAAWASQNYLTAIFLVRYTEAKKHNFGFIEEPELFRNDTLFLSMWHNAKEDGKTKTSQSYLALDLSYYNRYLSIRDSTVISLKYKAENSYSSGTDEYTYNVMYRRKYNSQ
ncbi:MAG: hypothetical protein LBS43_07090 [Prevotellaceae bacterium]|jgi:hypothetical protein|nr:hypothetical protein [Prevotellaceae bacterium]